MSQNRGVHESISSERRFRASRNWKKLLLKHPRRDPYSSGPPWRPTFSNPENVAGIRHPSWGSLSQSEVISQDGGRVASVGLNRARWREKNVARPKLRIKLKSNPMPSSYEPCCTCTHACICIPTPATPIQDNCFRSWLDFSPYAILCSRTHFSVTCICALPILSFLL